MVLQRYIEDYFLEKEIVELPLIKLNGSVGVFENWKWN
jgi:hypothetical protein